MGCEAIYLSNHGGRALDGLVDSFTKAVEFFLISDLLFFKFPPSSVYPSGDQQILPRDRKERQMRGLY
jgi:hypothetical protein